jgi:hypothetical protein
MYRGLRAVRHTAELCAHTSDYVELAEDNFATVVWTRWKTPKVYPGAESVYDNKSLKEAIWRAYG